METRDIKIVDDKPLVVNAPLAALMEEDAVA